MRNWDEVAQLQIFKKLRFVANAFIERMGADGSVNQFPALSLPIVLGQSAVAVSCPVDTTEDILATVPIPAKSMGPNGMLRITSQWSYTGSVNLKTFRIRLGGIGGAQYLNVTQNGTASNLSLFDTRNIANRGAHNSQVGIQTTMQAGGIIVYGLSQGVAVTSAIDTSLATTLVFTGQKATAGEVLTLEAYLVELLYGA